MPWLLLRRSWSRPSRLLTLLSRGRQIWSQLPRSACLLYCNTQPCNFKLFGQWLAHAHASEASELHSGGSCMLYFLSAAYTHLCCIAQTCNVDSVAAYCYVKVYMAIQTEHARLLLARFQPCLWYLLLLILGMLLAMRQNAWTQQHAAHAHGVWAAKQLITAVTGAGRRHCQFWLPEGAAYQGCTGQAENCQDQPGGQ